MRNGKKWKEMLLSPDESNPFLCYFLLRLPLMKKNLRDVGQREEGVLQKRERERERVEFNKLILCDSIGLV